MSQVQVAVIGYGHLGKWHCDKVEASDGACLSFIVEPFADNQKAAQDKFPHVKVVSSLDECIDKIDAGVVVTPTAFHFDINQKLLSAKKHIFCEKPLVSTFAQTTELQSIYSTDKVFQVGHSERFHEVWEDRSCFTPYLEKSHVEINRYAPFKGRATDVDVVQDLMIHDIDLLFYILGEYPTKVMSRGYKIRTELWDSVISTFMFASGVTATVNVGRNHCIERRDVTLTNHRGVCSINLMNEEVTIADPQSDELIVKTYERRDHLLVEHEHFYKSIIGGHKTVVTFTDGANAVRIVEGVLNSLECQGDFVSL